MRKYFRSFHLPLDVPKDQLQIDASFPSELQNTVIHSVSPSGRKQLIVKAENDNTILELWQGSSLAKEIQVPKALHGKAYADNWFGLGIAWSPDEDCVAYVAEDVPTQKTPEWGTCASKQEGDSPKDQGPKAGPKGWRGLGEFQEDWGELNTGKKVPRLYVADLKTDDVVAVKGLPLDTSAGQPIWTPDGRGLIFVAWPHKSINFPRLTQRLGIVHCANRPCFLYYLEDYTSAKDAEKIDTTLQNAICPQLSPDRRHLYFLSYETAVRSGAHYGTASLHRLSWPPSGNAEVVVDAVQTPQDPKAFPGLYCAALKPDMLAFLSDSRLLLSSAWRSSVQVLDVNIAADKSKASVSQSSQVSDHHTSSSLLAAKHGLAIGVTSGPRRAPSLNFARVQDGPLKWQILELKDSSEQLLVQDALSSSDTGFELLQLESASKVPFEAVLLTNVEKKKNAPTILVPHGGPHSVFPNSYLLSNLYFNILGYNVLQVNFRGSLGFGEAALQTLPGNIGTNDVQDCLAALEHAISTGWVDPEHVAVIGGSHGGFLTGHLLGQHPKRFKAGVLRNPVLDIALMSQISDIPDWCFIEAWGSKVGFEKAHVKTSVEDFKYLTSISPIQHIEQVTAPMFFMLGAKDRRVVMKDAQQYVAALRARQGSPEARVIVFPEDSHSLDKPQTEYEQWVNAAWWVKRFI